ncbi:Zn-ribbon domain-containing OB-fold protein [Falsiroseomonas sp. CW058]|uniref:Zn-ribbon domain-containing OB-fold protein n=1 Tax=Falsiroseomonas sp. CW058 TaxID=3388664 RepID=UPI003D3166ED
MSETKPAPHPSALTQPYWDGAARGVLRIQHCGACGKPRHYPRHICDACHSFEVEWKDSGGRGTVHSWTVAHHPFHPGFKDDLPYTLVVVDLAEGVRALGRFSEVTGAGLRIGLPVRLSFFEGGGGFALPTFAPEG